VEIAGVLRTKGSHVETVAPETPIPDVCEKMRVKGVGALVVSRDGQQVNGIISERDIVVGVAQEGLAALQRTAGHVMSKHVVTCRLDDHLTKVMAIMTNQRVRHVPVMAAGKLAGIISIGDVLKARLSEIQLEADVLRDMHLAGQ
jgi:signal-transduction protein with cAMP-binding, CBS, and nucleotidyltransferase domain